MSHLDFKSYAGVGTHNLEHFGYAQSVKVGDTVYISGQGGWATDDFSKYADTQEEQIDQAFRNIDVALREAGATFEHVFKVVSYHMPINDSALAQMKVSYEKWMPKHSPLWTALGISGLGDKRMLVEIEVTAHIPSK